MTRLLETAFEALKKLPEDQQDSVAEALLANLASEEAIDELIASRPDVLDRLVAEARVSIARGEGRPLLS